MAAVAPWIEAEGRISGAVTAGESAEGSGEVLVFDADLPADDFRGSVNSITGSRIGAGGDV